MFNDNTNQSIKQGYLMISITMLPVITAFPAFNNLYTQLELKQIYIQQAIKQNHLIISIIIVPVLTILVALNNLYTRLELKQIWIK